MEKTRVTQEVRERVLDRIRTAIAEGDEEAAMRIAKELQRRFRMAQVRREELDELLYA